MTAIISDDFNPLLNINGLFRSDLRSGRGKHCSSHCRHQQARMKVMSSHYLTGPFRMQISHRLLMTSKTQIPTLALPRGAFYLSHCGRYHTLERDPTASTCASLHSATTLCRIPFQGLAPLAWVTKHMSCHW